MRWLPVAADPRPVPDGLQELVDHSPLCQLRAPGPPRYLMLETIREFAAERLAGPPEAARLHPQLGPAGSTTLDSPGTAGSPAWIPPSPPR